MNYVKLFLLILGMVASVCLIVLGGASLAGFYMALPNISHEGAPIIRYILFFVGGVFAIAGGFTGFIYCGTRISEV
jgi:hypothetical protein